MTRHQEEIYLKEFLQMLAKRKAFLIAAIFICVFAGVVYSYNATPIYQANTTLVIGLESPEAFSGEKFVGLDASNKDYLKTQRAMLRSRSLAKAVIQTMNLKDSSEFIDPPSLIDFGPLNDAVGAFFSSLNFFKKEPVDMEGVNDIYFDLINEFHERLVTQPVVGSRIVEVGFQATSPKLAAEIVNTYTEMVIKKNIEFRSKSNKNSEHWMRERLADLRVKVRESEGALIEFKKNRNLTTNNLPKFEEEIRLTKSEVRKIEALKNQLIKFKDDPIETLQSIPDTVKTRVVHQLIEDRSAIKNELDGLLKRYRTNIKHPKTLALSQQLKTIEENFPIEINRLIRSINVDLEVTKAKVLSDERAWEEQKLVINQMSKNEYRFNSLNDEFDTYSLLYNNLMERVQKIDISSASRESDIKVLDQAEVPPLPIKPNKTINISFSFLVGLLGGSFLVLLREKFDDTVITVKDLENRFPFPFLGTISQFNKKDGPLPMAVNKDSFISEEFRKLRTNLMLNTFVVPKQVLMVASSNPEEGKTTITSNLAATFAQQGKKVLIIDADLLRPSVHGLFETPPQPGLIAALEGKKTVNQSISRSKVKGVFVLPCGILGNKSSVDILTYDNFKNVLGQVKETFDVILVDTPPALGFSYTSIIAKLSDGVIFVIGSGKSTRELVGKSLKQFAECDGLGNISRSSTQIVGIVLNGLSFKKNKHYDYYQKYLKNYYGYESDDNNGNASKNPISD
jgi:succinoglycan biosynthesis transport protein ExoP